MSREDASCRAILQSHCSSSEQLNLWGLRFLDTMGWAVRMSKAATMDLDATLQAMGAEEAALGITARYHWVLLQHLHSQLAARFPVEYTMAVRAAVDELFRSFVLRMTGNEDTF